MTEASYQWIEKGAATGLTNPVRVQRRRSKGFRLNSPNGLPVVYVGRPTVWGNRFSWEEHGRATAVALYWNFLFTTDIGRDLVQKSKVVLRGKNICCWCRLDEACHGDVWLEISNSS